MAHSKKLCHFIGQVFLTNFANSQLGAFGGQGKFYCVTKDILEISLAPLSIFEAFLRMCSNMYDTVQAGLINGDVESLQQIYEGLLNRVRAARKPDCILCTHCPRSLAWFRNSQH